MGRFHPSFRTAILIERFDDRMMCLILRQCAHIIVLLVAFSACAGSGSDSGSDNGTTASQGGVYDIPNDDMGCPADCRQVPWSAGSDQWNGGVLPPRIEVPCSPLTEGGNPAIDNSTLIQACIDTASPGTAVKIPPGIYYVDGQITLKSNVTLRGSGGGPGTQHRWLSSTYDGDTGAGAVNTTFKLGPGGWIFAGSTSSNNFGPAQKITSGYTKGSSTLTIEAGHGFMVGDLLSVYEDNDPAIVTNVGDLGLCNFCGSGNGEQAIQQFALVTKVTGQRVTINRPLYYTYKATLNPSATKLTVQVQKAGIEEIKLNGWSDLRTEAFVHFEGCLYCWVSGIETYNAPDCAKCNHVLIRYSHGVEVRNSFLHFGRENSSDRNYGISFFHWNSDHKIENNILRHHRHSIVFEGGGSGTVVLYNYIDDNYTDDLTYLGSSRINHGAHPMMNLYEGNWVSHLMADSYWGSSSHITLFRNWLRGAESQIDLPMNPNGGFIAADIAKDQKYYSLVGNVLGVSDWTSSGTVRNSGDCSVIEPVAYYYGCDSIGQFDGPTFDSTLSHGNYDYVSDSVAFWGGGSNHRLKSSMYYVSKPAFFENYAWPPFGPDLAPMTQSLPAKDRF